MAAEISRESNAFTLILSIQPVFAPSSTPGLGECNLLATAAARSDEQLRSPIPIGQGSVWKSLLHLYAAEYVWLESLHGSEEFLVPGELAGKYRYSVSFAVKVRILCTVL